MYFIETELHLRSADKKKVSDFTVFYNTSWGLTVAITGTLCYRAFTLSNVLSIRSADALECGSGVIIKTSIYDFKFEDFFTNYILEIFQVPVFTMHQSAPP